MVSRPILGQESPLHENYEKWARLHVTPDFWLYIPPHPGSNPRLLGVLKKLWMANTGRRPQRLLKPAIEYLQRDRRVPFPRGYTGSGTNSWLVFLNTVLQWQPSIRCDISVLGSFLSLLGLSDDFNIWADRVAAMAELEEHIGQNDRPGKHQGFLSRIDDSQINALRSNLCQRERTLPCLAAKKGVVTSLGTAQNLNDLKKRLERKTEIHAAST